MDTGRAVGRSIGGGRYADTATVILLVADQTRYQNNNSILVTGRVSGVSDTLYTLTKAGGSGIPVLSNAANAFAAVVLA